MSHIMFSRIHRFIKNNKKMTFLGLAAIPLVGYVKDRERIFSITPYINGTINPDHVRQMNSIDQNRSYISLVTSTPPGKTFGDFMTNPFGHSCIGINLTKDINIKDTFHNVKVYANGESSNSFMLNAVVIHTTEIGIKNPIHIITRDKYFYESDFNQNDQGGICNRTFYEIRFYVDEELIYKLIDYFVDLYNKMETKENKFSLYGHLKIYKSYKKREKEGNCSYWISKGLQHVGIIKSHSYYPGVLFFKTLANIKPNSSVYKYESLDYDDSLAGDGVILTPFVPIFVRMTKKENKTIDYTVRAIKSNINIINNNNIYDIYDLEIRKEENERIQ